MTERAKDLAHFTAALTVFYAIPLAIIHWIVNHR